jgi:hypothetical protein
LEKQPSATTTSFAQNDSFCSAPSLRAYYDHAGRARIFCTRRSRGPGHCTLLRRRLSSCARGRHRCRLVETGAQTERAQRRYASWLEKLDNDAVWPDEAAFEEGFAEGRGGMEELRWRERVRRRSLRCLRRRGRAVCDMPGHLIRHSLTLFVTLLFR